MLLSLTSQFDNNNKFDVEALILRSITPDLPASPIVVKNYDLFRDKNMADPYFFRPGKIDILLGALGYYDIILPDSVIKLDKGLRVMNTIFGWVVGGSASLNGDSTVAHTTTVESVSKIDESLRKFWLIDEVPNESAPISENERCEDHFVKHVTRLANGRFSISLPFKRDRADVGDSFKGAKRRFYMLQGRLEKNPELKMKYFEFMLSYLSNGHMEPASSPFYITPA
ncbi:uncharacterized protein LOC122520380 [Polistes fuscatus]|uniref:uncharacterized protein LOC122520380 n=1 Tax=Polistes fuscatus TaxID=30207 RepID=UPI001CA8F85A|nr:uncharacterized protein LOC122520380 [Polistes fuscatus]